MSFLQLASNTEQIQGMLGRVVREPNFSRVPAIINPASAATSIQVGDVVKLVAGTPANLPNGQIVVDVLTGPTDSAQIYGVIVANPRTNTYKAGDEVLIAGRGAVVALLASAAIAPGATVSVTSSTTTADPTVATDVTSGHQLLGIAVGNATAAGQLVNIQVEPSTHA